jgi:hypothetical protein
MCDCWKSRALALLPAPGEPSKLAETILETARLHSAWRGIPSEEANLKVLALTARNLKLDALCALYREGK